MKYNPLFIICIVSFLFFQFLPMSFVMLFPAIEDLLNFKEDTTSYFALLLLSIALFLVGYYILGNKKMNIEKLYIKFNHQQPFFWKIGNLIAYAGFIPAMVVAVIVYARIMAEGYGEVEPTKGFENIIFYGHLMGLSFLFAGYTNDVSIKKLILPLALIIFPRFLVSTSGPRFFVFQALLPTFFFIYPLTKHYIKKYFYLVAVFGFSLIILPYLIGNRAGGELDFVSVYIFGSPILYMLYEPLNTFAKMHMVTAGLLYSFFGADIFGYKKLFDLGGYKIRMDWIYTRITIGPEGEHFLGMGGNPIYEAATEGIVIFMILFFIVGVMCKHFDYRKYSMVNRFVFPHVIAKIGFFWRGTFVELIDRTVYYILIFLVFYLVSFFYTYKNSLE